MTLLLALLGSFGPFPVTAVVAYAMLYEMTTEVGILYGYLFYVTFVEAR